MCLLHSFCHVYVVGGCESGWVSIIGFWKYLYSADRNTLLFIWIKFKVRYNNLNMICDWKNIFLLTIILTLASLSLAADSDCLKTGANGICLACSNGKVAFNGKCIDSILHCL